MWDRRARQVADMSSAKFSRIVPTLAPADQKAAIRMRFRYDLPAFCRYCWPERFNLPFSDLHDELFERALKLGHWSDRRKTTRDAIAAPRGYAKSTISSFAVLAHSIVYGLDAYIVLLSAGQRLSFSLSRDLRNAFTSANSPLLDLYGPFDVTGAIGEFEVSVNGKLSVGVLAASFGSEVRGAKHPEQGIRPTRAVIDDGEKKDRVRNPVQRAIWWDFLTKDVLKLGPPNSGLACEVRGTILHSDSMLARCLKSPGWRSKRYQAIESWPDRMDLWERCGGYWKDLTLGESRQDAALAFYEANREDMDSGAVVLGDRSLFSLHEQIWAEGLASFLQEMQNDPVDPETSLFVLEQISRFRVTIDPIEGPVVIRDDGRVVRIADMKRTARWDPASGTVFGDFSAIAVIGRDKWGYGYVLDCWLKKAKPSAQLQAAWSLAERWGLNRISLESNGFQDLVAEPFMRERESRRERGKFWKLRIDEEPTTENKIARISSLEPDVSNGWLSFSTSLPHEALQQFADFPTADHDDAPDAIQWAWRESGGSPVVMGSKRIR